MTTITREKMNQRINADDGDKICVLGGRDVDKYTTGGKSKLERLIEAGEIDV